MVQSRNESIASQNNCVKPYDFILYHWFHKKTYIMYNSL